MPGSPNSGCLLLLLGSHPLLRAPVCLSIIPQAPPVACEKSPKPGLHLSRHRALVLGRLLLRIVRSHPNDQRHWGRQHLNHHEMQFDGVLDEALLPQMIRQLEGHSPLRSACEGNRQCLICMPILANLLPRHLCEHSRCLLVHQVLDLRRYVRGLAPQALRAPVIWVLSRTLALVCAQRAAGIEAIAHVTFAQIELE